MFNFKQNSSNQLQPQLQQQQNLNRLRYVRLVTSMMNSNNNNGKSSGAVSGGYGGGGRTINIASPLNFRTAQGNLSNSSILLPLHNSISDTNLFVSFLL